MTNDAPSLLDELLDNALDGLRTLGLWHGKLQEHIYALGGWMTVPTQTPSDLAAVLKSQTAIVAVDDILRHELQPQSLRWIGPCGPYTDLVGRALDVGHYAGWAERGWRSSVGVLLQAVAVQQSVLTASIRAARGKIDDGTTDARRYLVWFFRLDEGTESSSSNDTNILLP